MNYAFVNSLKDATEQKKSIIDLAFERNLKIDVWLEGPIQLLKKIIHENYLNKNDNLFFSNFEDIDMDSLINKLEFYNYILDHKICIFSINPEKNYDDFADLQIYSSYSDNVVKIKGDRTKKMISVKELYDKNIPVNSICKIFDLKRTEVKRIFSKVV